MQRAALALTLLLAACTFPDVDYADVGGTSGGGTCNVPTKCADDAMTCATHAENKHKSCRNQCKPSMPDCPGQCDQAQTTALGKCAASCASCASPDCGSRATNCDALVGL